MENVHSIFYLLFLTFGIIECSVLPVEKCVLTDKSCMLPAVQKMVPVFTAGMPDLGVEVLDLLNLDHVKFDLSGLQFSLKDGTLKGLKSAVFDTVDWDLKKKMFTLGFHFDAFMRGHYTAGGRVLILPVTGDGQLKMKLKNLHVKIYLHYDLVKIDGKDHIKLTKYIHEFDVKDNAHFHLTNLFNGNRELSDTLLTFLNQNWKTITTEFGAPLVDAAVKKVYKNVGALFQKLPLEDIAKV